MNQMHRCVNDKWGYCDGKPECEWSQVVDASGAELEIPTTPCAKDAKACKAFRSWYEVASR